MARRKCSICGLYVGAKPHTGPMHRAIQANRDRLRRGLALRPRRRR